MAGGFRVEASEVLHRGAIVSTERLSVRTPDGDLIERQAIRHPGAVAVVAVHEGDVVLVEQYRAAIDDLLIEVPAGKLDADDESLESAARRELLEEVGLEPGSIIRLGEFLTAAGFSDEVVTIFAATDCVEVGQRVDGVEEAHMTVLKVPAAEALANAAAGHYRDSKTVIGLFWAQTRGLLEG